MGDIYQKNKFVGNFTEPAWSQQAWTFTVEDTLSRVRSGFFYFIKVRFICCEIHFQLTLLKSVEPPLKNIENVQTVIQESSSVRQANTLRGAPSENQTPRVCIIKSLSGWTVQLSSKNVEKNFQKGILFWKTSMVHVRSFRS